MVYVNVVAEISRLHVNCTGTWELMQPFDPLRSSSVLSYQGEKNLVNISVTIRKGLAKHNSKSSNLF